MVQICPDENSIKGSSALFAAMAHCMVQRSLIGIGAFSRTKSSMPRLVALLPHLEPADGAENAIFGMNVITIPYSNEIRPVECMDLGGVNGEPLTDEEKTVAVEIARKMQFTDGFQYQDLQSPAIQHMYAVLQAVALNQVGCHCDIMNVKIIPCRSLLSGVVRVICYNQTLQVPLSFIYSSVSWLLL